MHLSKRFWVCKIYFLDILIFNFQCLTGCGRYGRTFCMHRICSFVASFFGNCFLVVVWNILDNNKYHPMKFWYNLRRATCSRAGLIKPNGGVMIVLLALHQLILYTAEICFIDNLRYVINGLFIILLYGSINY